MVPELPHRGSIARLLVRKLAMGMSCREMLSLDSQCVGQLFRMSRLVNGGVALTAYTSLSVRYGWTEVSRVIDLSYCSDFDGIATLPEAQ